MFMWAALIYPVNDITTTPEQPPAYVEIAKLEANKGRDMSYSEDARAKQQKLYPDLAPLKLSVPPDRAFKNILAAAKRQADWSLVHADEANFRLEATATTALLKFTDDIVIEIRPEGGGSSVHMRSKSRLGRSDLGANRKRIKLYLDLLQKSG